jgi:hypothetical protein
MATLGSDQSADSGLAWPGGNAARLHIMLA